MKSGTPLQLGDKWVHILLTNKEYLVGILVPNLSYSWFSTVLKISSLHLCSPKQTYWNSMEIYTTGSIINKANQWRFSPKSCMQWLLNTLYTRLNPRERGFKHKIAHSHAPSSYISTVGIGYSSYCIRSSVPDGI